MHLAKQYPNRQILVERQESGKWKGMAFSDLQQTAEQLACSLIHSKIKPCSAVILAGETSPSMICCLLGCAFAAYPAFIIDSIAEYEPNVSLVTLSISASWSKCGTPMTPMPS